MHPRTKKVTRVFALLFGGLLAFLCVAAAGALLWLRTDWGEKTVAAAAINALAEQGLFLSVEQLDGPLPTRLLLKNVRLADADGEWFAARELEVAIDLLPLLGRTAAVSLARVDAPRVYRLPTLPPSPEPENPAEPEGPATPGHFSLPIGIRLDSLAISGLEIFTPLLFPDAAAPGAATAEASPLFRADITGNAEADAEQPLNAAVSISAAVADMDALTEHTGPLPVSAFAVTLNAKATVGMVIEAALSGTLTPVWERAPHAFDYSIAAILAGNNAALRSLTLHGAGIDLNAKGGANLNTLAANVEATLHTDAGGAWESFVAGLVGRDVGGAIAASLAGSLAEDRSMSASVDLSGSSMRWGDAQMQEILGQSFALKAEAAGGESTAYALTLHTLEAGAVSASGTASFGPRTKAIAADLKAAVASLAPVAPGLEGALRAKLNASGTLDTPAASFEISGDAIRHPAISVDGLRAKGALSGTLQAPVAVATVAAASLTADAAALENVRAEANLSGTLTAPLFSVTAASGTIRTDAGEFREFRAGINGSARLPENADKTVSAAADVSLGASPAGPVRLQTTLDAAQKPAGELTARLRGLNLSLAGTDLTADISAVVPPSGSAAMPSITGNTSARVTDWRPLAALIGMPLSGRTAELEAAFSHHEGIQEITAAVRADALSLPDAFALNGLVANLKARDLANPDIALMLTMGKGEAGPVTWRSGAAHVTARQGTGAFAVALRSNKTAEAALPGLMNKPPEKPGKAERLTAAGSFSLSPIRITFDRLAARVPKSPMGIYLTQPATVSMGDAVSVQGFALAVTPGKGSVALDATLSGRNAELAATITEFPLRFIREAANAPVPDGTLSAEAAIRKSGTAIQGTVNAKALVYPPTASGPENPPVAFTLESTLDRAADLHFPHLTSGRNIFRLKGGIVIGLADAAGGADANAPDAHIFFNVPLRVEANGIPEPAMNEHMGAQVTWMGEIAPLWALAPMQDRNLSGLAKINAEVKGPLAAPEYAASAYIAGGRFEDHILGVMLTDIALEAAGDSSGASNIVLRAGDGVGGYVALEGALSPPTGKDAEEFGSKAPRLTSRGQINHLQPLHRDDLFLRLSGRFSANGPLDELAVAANIEVERGELSIANLTSGVTTLDITDSDAPEEKASSGPTLDVTVLIPHRFHIRGRGLESEWEGKLAVTGTASSPVLTGSLAPVRGTFSLLSRGFAFTEGDITLLGGDRIDPALNLTLEYQGPNITAIVRATGSVSKPEIAMESQPSLPQDQIMAQVLFGKDFSKLSRFEALQVANGLRQLANIGGDGLDPLASMRTRLGVDMLRLGSGSGDGGDNRSVSGAPSAQALGAGGSPSTASTSETIPTLEAGKYINDVIYVGVEQGATSDSTGVRVEIELKPNLSLQGRTSTRSSEVGLGWKRDY